VRTSAGVIGSGAGLGRSVANDNDNLSAGMKPRRIGVRNSRSSGIIRQDRRIALARYDRGDGIIGARAGPPAFVTEDVMSKKTVCPVNRAEFRRSAKPISVNIAGIPLVADVKEFSTGSLGWYLNGKVSVEIDGRPVAVQIGMNLTIVGSKELPADEPTTEAA
jgi:hypothetical protein